jgi:hypothetical protein
LNGVLPAQASFARVSAGSRFNASGVLESVASGAPRFDYSYNTTTGLWVPAGILIEPQATNLLQQTSLLSAWYAENSHVLSTDSTITAPDGTSGVRKLTSGGNNQCRMNVYNSISATAGQTYTQSCYFKLGTLRYGYIFLNVGGVQAGALFDLQTCSFAGAASSYSALAGHSITQISNGWMRATASVVATTTVSSYYSCRPGFASTSALTFPNDAITAGEYGYLWGAQYELGTKATSYVQSGSSIATRAADQLSFTIPSGVSSLRYVFDDGSTQDVSVSSGSYTVPTTLNRSHIKRIYAR